MKRDIYMRMRETGMSLQDIANVFGVTRQAVSVSLKRGSRKNKPYEYAGTKTVVYPAMRNWLIAHHCSVSRLERLAGCNLRLSLQNGTLTQSQRQRISRATGLSPVQLLEVQYVTDTA